MNNHDGAEQYKLFVGGLSWETNEDRLKGYFSEFGEVIECLVMKNNETGKSRGFGFVTFKDPNSVKHVLSINGHQLDGRTIDPKECNPKNAARTRKEAKQGNTPKVFLGGLPANITETGLKDYFTKYGKVTEVIIMYDQEKKKSRGFGFLSFESEDSINKVVAEHYVNINGKQVEVKRAEPQHMKSGTPGPNGNAHHHHHPNMSMPPFYAMTPWGMWPAGPMMPPNGVNPQAMNYQNYQNSWNSTTAAAAAAAAAAALSASSPANAWPGYGYPQVYAQPHAFQPPNSSNSQAAGTNGHGQPTTGAQFLPPGNVANMNQNVPNNSNLSSPMMPPGMSMPGNGAGYPQHEQANAGFSRPGPNNFANAGAGFPGHNTHSNSMGYGPPSSSMPPPPGGPHHPGPDGAPPGMHPNSFNGSIPFGSRMASQNQGYHPYRRS